MELGEVRGRHVGRCVLKEGASRRGLGKRDHVAQRRRAREEHRDAVEAERDAAVRRRPGAQRLEQEPEPPLLLRRVADAEDFEALYALEAMSNERSRQELGQIDRVPRHERLFGPGSGPIMAAFTHVNVLGSMIFAGMSGSAVADAAGLGVIEIRAMIKEGYKAKFAATIVEALGTEPPRPAGLEGIEQLPKRVKVMSVDVDAVKAYIHAHV